METPHRTFGLVARPWLDKKRKKLISRILTFRKFGLSASELARAQKRRERKIASTDADGIGGLADDEGRMSEDEDEEIVEEADVRALEEEVAASEALVAVLKGRQSVFRESKKQTMAVLKQVLKETRLI